MDKFSLSDTFVSIIQKWLTEDELQELRRKNRYLDKDKICYSHDYIDANQAMIDALKKHNQQLDLQNETQLKLINESWNTAKKNNFMTQLQLL